MVRARMLLVSAKWSPKAALRALRMPLARRLGGSGGVSPAAGAAGAVPGFPEGSQVEQAAAPWRMAV